nr:hypothetical protein HAGR004_15050 [Bdellovibrio sp. HAGR004]
MSSEDVAIKVQGLSKCFEIYETPRDRLKQFLLPRLRRVFGRSPRQYYREFWALKDVSFEVKKGETVGIVGRNGSGKSTLLQLICGTLSPTGGSVQTNGRIAALLELGSGFNPEFTGRENVFLSCALLGLSRDEVNEKFDEIVSFADIGDFIDQPVKTYSSGMYVRLAFAVNIVSQPDIMIVDEALAVGDMAFQAKCMTALTRIQEKGATVLFVSHDIGSIKSLCSRALYLECGEVKGFSKASDIAELYIRVMREEMNHQNAMLAEPNGNAIMKPRECEGSKNTLVEFKRSVEFERRVALFRYGTGSAKITFVEMLDTDGQPVVAADFNQEVQIKIYFESFCDTQISANYYIQDDKKNLILGAGMRLIGEKLLHCEPNGNYIVTYKTTLPLHEGTHSIQVQLTTPVVVDQTAEFLDVVDDAIVFKMNRRAAARIWTRAYVHNSIQVQIL